MKHKEIFIGIAIGVASIVIANIILKKLNMKAQMEQEQQLLSHGY